VKARTNAVNVSVQLRITWVFTVIVPDSVNTSEVLRAVEALHCLGFTNCNADVLSGQNRQRRLSRQLTIVVTSDGRETNGILANVSPVTRSSLASFLGVNESSVALSSSAPITDLSATVTIIVFAVEIGEDSYFLDWASPGGVADSVAQELLVSTSQVTIIDAAIIVAPPAAPPVLPTTPSPSDVAPPAAPQVLPTTPSPSAFPITPPHTPPTTPPSPPQAPPPQSPPDPPTAPPTPSVPQWPPGQPLIGLGGSQAVTITDLGGGSLLPVFITVLLVAVILCVACVLKGSKGRKVKDGPDHDEAPSSSQGGQAREPQPEAPSSSTTAKGALNPVRSTRDVPFNQKLGPLPPIPRRNQVFPCGDLESSSAVQSGMRNSHSEATFATCSPPEVHDTGYSLLSGSNAALEGAALETNSSGFQADWRYRQEISY